jgi:hypothetical protein
MAVNVWQLVFVLGGCLLTAWLTFLTKGSLPFSLAGDEKRMRGKRYPKNNQL